MQAVHAFTPDHSVSWSSLHDPDVAAGSILTPAERRAIELGRDEAFRLGWDAGREPVGRLRLMLIRLTGWRLPMPLADLRLEKLRLFAAMMRRDDRRVHGLADELRDAGLTSAALHQAINLALA